MWVWWVLIEESVVMVGRCLQMICYWFAVGLMEEELVEEGRRCILVFGERKGQSIVKEFW